MLYRIWKYGFVDPDIALETRLTKADFEVAVFPYFFRAGALDEVPPGVLALLGLIVPE